MAEEINRKGRKAVRKRKVPKDQKVILPEIAPHLLLPPEWKRMVPILSRHKVGLWPSGGDGDDARFARLFRETMQRLPLGPRRRILKHWRECSLALGGLSPMIQLGLWATEHFEKDDLTATTWAEVKHRGHHLCFFSRIVDRMPDELVRDLIAHELAHVWQEATFITGRCLDTDKTLIAIDRSGCEWLPGELEEHADDLMESWGFNATAMDDWSLREGISRTREVTLEEFIDLEDQFMRTGRRFGSRSESRPPDHD